MREVSLEEAIVELKLGRLVAFPTETVYGLGADGLNAAAVAQIFRAKGRPQDHPLILHLAEVSELDRYVEVVPPAARRLADVLWPGPLTLVLPKAAIVPDVVTGGRATVALRVPLHPLARALIRGVGHPLAAPSANRFGRVSPTSADHVRADLGDIDIALLDGGPASVGIESTIVDCSEGAPVILRSGGVSQETLEEVLGAPVPLRTEGSVRAPGMHASHYAPRARVVALAPDEVVGFVGATHEPFVLLAAEAHAVPHGSRCLVLPADAATRARELYATLRSLDESGASLIAIELPAAKGLGLAVADRVRRAAAPRP